MYIFSRVQAVDIELGAFRRSVIKKYETTLIANLDVDMAMFHAIECKRNFDS